jgi:hypothetical protein
MRRFWPAGSALVAGLVLGLMTAIEARRPGFAAFGALVYVLIGGLIVVGLVVVAVVAVFMSRRRLAETAFLSGVALVAGTVLAAAAFQVVVPRPKQPVFLVATATGSLEVDAEGFVPAAKWNAVCTSRADSSELGGIEIRDLGELNRATLRAFMTVPIAGQTSEVGFFVDVGDPVATLAWRGVVGLDLSNGGVSGSATFPRLRLEQLTPGPAPEGDWPSSLSGVLRWTCDPWLPAGSYLQ